MPPQAERNQLSSDQNSCTLVLVGKSVLSDFAGDSAPPLSKVCAGFPLKYLVLACVLAYLELPQAVHSEFRL